MSYLHTIDQVRQEILKPIMPTGETEIDNERFVNLQEHIQIVDMLLGDVIDVFVHGYGTTPTKLRAARSALGYLESVYNLLGEVLER